MSNLKLVILFIVHLVNGITTIYKPMYLVVSGVLLHFSKPKCFVFACAILLITPSVNKFIPRSK